MEKPFKALLVVLLEFASPPWLVQTANNPDTSFTCKPHLFMARSFGVGWAFFQSLCRDSPFASSQKYWQSRRTLRANTEAKSCKQHTMEPHRKGVWSSVGQSWTVDLCRASLDGKQASEPSCILPWLYMSFAPTSKNSTRAGPIFNCPRHWSRAGLELSTIPLRCFASTKNGQCLGRQVHRHSTSPGHQCRMAFVQQCGLRSKHRDLASRSGSLPQLRWTLAAWMRISQLPQR